MLEAGQDVLRLDAAERRQVADVAGGEIGRAQTLSTPFLVGASQEILPPSGERRGSVRSGLPNRSCRGMSGAGEAGARDGAGGACDAAGETGARDAEATGAAPASRNARS
jgi:hypothetical protein